MSRTRSGLFYLPVVWVMMFLTLGILLGDVLGMVRGGLVFLLLWAGYGAMAWPVLWGSPAVAACLGLLAGAWGLYGVVPPGHASLSAGHVARYCDGRVYDIQGRIASFQEHYPGKTRVRLSVCGLKPHKGDGQRRRIVEGRVFLNFYGPEQFCAGYGDLVTVSAALKPVRNFNNPGGFDYRTFLRRQGIYGSVNTRVFKVRVQQSRALRDRFMQQLEALRNGFFDLVRARLGSADAAHILNAMVTGKKRMIPPDLRDRFAKTGTAHLLAISGLHMSILGLVAFWISFGLLSFFRPWLISGRAKKAAWVLTLGLLFIYGLFSGFSPSTLRAFIMAAVFALSFILEREAFSFNTLALAGVVILVLEPSALFSISFQLSFFAVAFILAGFDLARKFGMMAQHKIIVHGAGACLVPLAAGLGTLPLTACYFNMVSHVQVFANLLLVPLVGFVCLPLGFLAFVLFCIHPGFAGPLVDLCGVLIHGALALAGCLESLPFAWTRVGTPDKLALALIYLGFLGVYLLLKTGKKKVWGAFLGGVLLLFLADVGMAAWKRFHPGDTRITVLDVGQGNSCLIRSETGHTVLVDGGGFSGLSTFDPGRHIVAPFLWQQHILTLDMVVLTHPEADHMNGLVFILENFKVKRFVKNRDARDTGAYRKMMAICRNKAIGLVHPGPGTTQIGLGRAGLCFFGVPAGHPDINFNDNCLVFKFCQDDFSMLFAGDVMTTRERILTDSLGGRLDSDLLLCPHHGSQSSSNDFFLEKVSPESVIISCGFANRYGFPHALVLNRYMDRKCRVFRTDIHGAVTVSISGGTYNILPVIRTSGKG